MSDTDRLDEAQALIQQGPLQGDLLNLSWLQRTMRVGHEEAVEIASGLEERGDISGDWREEAREQALRSYGEVARDHAQAMAAGVEDGELAGALLDQRQAAARLGAGPEDLEQAREISEAEQVAAHAEVHNEGLAADAVREQIHTEVETALGLDEDSDIDL